MTTAHPLTARPASARRRPFWRCCQANGLTAFCDALTYSGLRDELPRLAEPGITVLAPTNEAFAQISDAARGEQRLVRQLILGHICSGTSSLAEVRAKNCAVAVAGQTHACYLEEGHVHIGTGRLGRTDITFEGGVIHEVSSCLMVLSLIRDSHSEQVWKKALQPAPVLAALGGISTMEVGAEFEVHGCLLHAATGQLVPEALRGHVRPIKPVNEEQRLTFSELTVMTKPPSLAKRKGASGAPDGSNRYRLLFSIWNTTSLSYISWQHMATPLVVRNSFHMLPIEEKNYRRQQYARARSGGNGLKDMAGDISGLPPLHEEASTGGHEEGATGEAPPDVAPPKGDSLRVSFSSQLGSDGHKGDSIRSHEEDEKLKRLSIGSGEAAALLDETGGEEHLRQLQVQAAAAAEAHARQQQLQQQSVMAPVHAQPKAPQPGSWNPNEWLPLSQAARLPGPADGMPPSVIPRGFVSVPTSRLDRATSIGEESGSESQDHSSLVVGSESRDSIGNEPLWLSMAASATAEPQDVYMQLNGNNNTNGNGVRAKSPTMAMPPAAPPPSSAAIAFFGANGGAPAQNAFQFTGGAGGGPHLVDASCREGTCSGGTIIWLHGEQLSASTSVRFGGVGASSVEVVSDKLIKCVAPEFTPVYSPQVPEGRQPRHEVAISLVDTHTGQPLGGTIPFAYISDPDGAGLDKEHQPIPKELLRRLLASLERAQTAATAAAASAPPDSNGVSSGGAELSLSAFNAMDEHGYSLAEYSSELKDALNLRGDGKRSSFNSTGASDLQAQHQEMANMLKRERLSASLAKRPSLDALQQRNILPDSSRVSLSRERLASSFASRPPVELLQERNILHTADEKLKQEAKRKRLEGFLAERPTLEQLQAHLGSTGEDLLAEVAHRRGSLEATLAGSHPILDNTALPTLDSGMGSLPDSLRLDPDSLRLDEADIDTVMQS